MPDENRLEPECDALLLSQRDALLLKHQGPQEIKHHVQQQLRSILVVKQKLV